MLDPELAPCLHAPGPVASLYLPTPSKDPQAARHATLRWKNLRRELAEAGADEPTLAAMDQAIGVDTVSVAAAITGAPENHPAAAPADDEADHGEGDVLAVIAAEGKVLLRRALPADSGGDGARWSATAWLTPLLASAQAATPYLVVLLDRKGADIWGVAADGDVVDEQMEGADFPLRRTQQGGWSQRRIQQRAINTWEANATEVAETVAELAGRLQSERVLVAGEDHAVHSFLAAAPAALVPLIRKLDAGTRNDPDAAAAEVERLVRSVQAEDTVAQIQAFRAELGGARHAASGARAVVGALQMAMVDTLLIHDDPSDDRLGWMAIDGSQVALEERELTEMGIQEVAAGRLIDVCVRTALLQGAEVRLMPGSLLEGGIGALLRATAVTSG